MVRKHDILARFGGEEFIVLLPKTDLDTAAILAEKIRKSCEDYTYTLAFEKDNKRQEVQHKQTISVGVSELSDEMSSPKSLLENADNKLYQSKSTGRNKFTSCETNVFFH